MCAKITVCRIWTSLVPKSFTLATNAWWACFLTTPSCDSLRWIHTKRLYRCEPTSVVSTSWTSKPKDTHVLLKKHITFVYHCISLWEELINRAGLPRDTETGDWWSRVISAADDFIWQEVIFSSWTGFPGGKLDRDIKQSNQAAQYIRVCMIAASIRRQKDLMGKAHGKCEPQNGFLWNKTVVWSPFLGEGDCGAGYSRTDFFCFEHV